jgi:hypothetical protein
MNTLYVLWFLATLSYSIPVGLCAAKSLLKYRRCHKTSALFMGVFFTSAFTEGVIAGSSLLLWWPAEYSDTPWFAISRVTGRSILCLGAWLFMLYLFDVIGDKKIRSDQEKISEMTTELKTAE